MERLFNGGGKGRVLLFGAHPDDIELGAGGTVARLVQSGADVTHVVVSVPTEYEVRFKEAGAGADALGAKHLILFPKQQRVEDIPMYELVRAMDAILSDLRPEFVFVHSHSDLHWDHGLVNRAAISALRRTPANLFAFTSSYELNAQSRALGQCFVDITGTISRKLAAISAHTSQITRIDLEGTRDLARAMGRIAGVTFAEVFEVLRLRL